MTNGNKSVLSTWQWLGVISAIIVGAVGIDARIQGTVGALAEANDVDHALIRAQIKDLTTNIPPDWFRQQVDGNTASINELEKELSRLRVVITELSATTKVLSERLERSD